MHICMPSAASSHKLRCCTDHMASACQVRMSQQMAQVQNDHIIESQRDMIEIRGMVQDLLVAFEWYLRTWSTVWDSDTFQAVVQDIEEVRLSKANCINSDLTSWSRKLVIFHPLPLPFQRCVHCK